MSNLLQKASIITTPTAYNDGKLLSVKPVEYYGPELVTNGTFDTDTNWNKEAGGWSISGGTANGTTTSNPIYQSISGFISGNVYKVKFEVTSVTSGYVRVYAYVGASGTFTNIFNSQSLTTGVYETTFVFGGTNKILRFYGSVPSTGRFTGSIDNVSVKEVLNADFDFTRGSSATRVGSNGLIQTVASGLPRIDYSGGVGHILTEPERTNLITYSESFSNSYWAKTRASITSNSIISPDGTLNASKLIEDTANGSHFLLVNPVYTTSSVNNVVSLSLFAKKSERHLQIQSFASGGGENPKVNFDLTNRTANSVGNMTPTFSIQSFGNDWYRCNLSYTVSQSNSGVRFYISLFNGTSTSYQGDGSSGVYIYGAQLEAGSYQTSYIVSNSGNATTRLAETLNNSGSADLINSTSGVLYAEISALADEFVDKRIALSDGTMNNYVSIGYSRFSGKIVAEIISGGVLQTIDWGATGVTQTNNNKFALSWGNGTMKFYVNGTQTNIENVTSPTGMNDFSFSAANNSLKMFSKTKSVAVFKDALSDLELECLSSWMSFADMGIALGYTIE